MKTVVVGAGAMGTFITARLCMAGHEVWLLEVNDKRVTKIKENENHEENVSYNTSLSSIFMELFLIFLNIVLQN